jgi:hypothetical protein
MMRNGGLYPLPNVERHIEESGSLSWPTPQAAETGRSFDAYNAAREKHGSVLQASLEIAALMWPTPDASMGTGGCTGPSRETKQVTLNHSVKSWATPTARDNKGADAPNRHGSASLCEQTKAHGSLNPAWCLALMGFPLEWLDGLPDRERRNTTGSRRERAKKPKSERQSSKPSGTP